MAPSDSSEIPAAMRALGNKGTWPGDIKRLCSSCFLSYQVTTPELPLLPDSFDGRRHYEFAAFAVDGGFSTWDLPIQRFKVSNDEAATAFVARFDALTTKLQGKSTSIVFPDIHLQQRFLRALPTSGHRDFSEILDKHHRVDFSNLAELQKAVVDEEKVLMKKAVLSRAMAPLLWLLPMRRMRIWHLLAPRRQSGKRRKHGDVPKRFLLQVNLPRLHPSSFLTTPGPMPQRIPTTASTTLAPAARSTATEGRDARAPFSWCT